MYLKNCGMESDSTFWSIAVKYHTCYDGAVWQARQDPNTGLRDKGIHSRRNFKVNTKKIIIITKKL